MLGLVIGSALLLLARQTRGAVDCQADAPFTPFHAGSLGNGLVEVHDLCFNSDKSTLMAVGSIFDIVSVFSQYGLLLTLDYTTDFSASNVYSSNTVLPMTVQNYNNIVRQCAGFEGSTNEWAAVSYYPLTLFYFDSVTPANAATFYIDTDDAADLYLSSSIASQGTDVYVTSYLTGNTVRVFKISSFVAGPIVEQSFATGSTSLTNVGLANDGTSLYLQVITEVTAARKVLGVFKIQLSDLTY